MEKQSHKALLRDVEVAKILGCHKSSVWSLYNSGRLPRPLRLGGMTRWRLAEINQWVMAGCPSREKWNWTDEKGGKNE